MKRIVDIIKKLIAKGRSDYPRSEFGAIGEHTIIGKYCSLNPRNMFLDDYTIIQDRNNFISYKGKFVVKKYSVISSSCIIIPSNHLPCVGVPFYLATIEHIIPDEDTTIIVGEDCWIGAGSILLPGCKIGRGCTIGAGSVVTHEIPPYSIAVGVPARVIASKYSLDDIKAHEKQLYPEEERMLDKDLETLFRGPFAGLRCGEKHILTLEEFNAVAAAKKEMGLPTYD